MKIFLKVYPNIRRAKYEFQKYMDSIEFRALTEVAKVTITAYSCEIKLENSTVIKWVGISNENDLCYIRGISVTDFWIDDAVRTDVGIDAYLSTQKR